MRLIFALLMVACTGGDPGSLPGIPTPDGEAKLLAVPPIVGRPTSASATVNIVAGPTPVTVELDLVPPGGTPVAAAIEADEARDLLIDNLEAGTEYRYRLTALGDGREEVTEGRFVTRREPGTPFTFALVSDTHLPAPAPEWTDPAIAELFFEEILEFLQGRMEIGETIRRAMASIRDQRVDFIICLGDMVHYWRGFNGPLPTAKVADFAYLDLRAHLGQTTAETAFFATLGNWDSESGWQPGRLQRVAREARLKYLPNPQATTYRQGGGPHEDYYAWTWGDALFVVLNVATYTLTAHTLNEDDDGTADDWTLGAEQLTWLGNTLERSEERFKLLFIHHPVGGRGGDERNSAYGRGGGRAAEIGEQAAIHALMRRHDVQAFFYGHDHVFTDMVVDGIHYTLPGSAGAPWKFPTEETGYDEYDERSGFALVHVAPDSLKIEFRDLDGEVFKVLEPETGEAQPEPPRAG